MEKRKEKEITISDLARDLDVSVSTVSRGLQNSPVISKQTRKRIQDLAVTMGYRSNYFARNLRHQRSYTIGVIVPRLNSQLMSAILAGMENIASKAGFNLIISQSLESVTREIANAITMFNNRVDGLFVSSAYDAQDSQHFDIFLKKKIPVVFFDRVTDDHSYTKVLIHNRKAADDATMHLIAQGCRRIIHITAHSSNHVYADRLQGYKDALNRAGIPFDKNLIIQNDLSYEAGIVAAEMIRQLKPLPDGVFVADDNCAVSCMSTLEKAGIRIPDDVAFVGFNNSSVSKIVKPNLTTIHYPGQEMGEIAMCHMVNFLNSDSAASVLNTITLRTELIVRASSLRAKV